MAKGSKRKSVSSILIVLLLGVLSAACESPYMIKHPVAVGDVYYLYATYYGDEYNGRGMANGEPFSNSAMTCAARGFPFGTVLEVYSIDTGDSVEVVVTDRPGKNVVDLTKSAFERISPLQAGKIRAKIKVVSLTSDAKQAENAPAAQKSGPKKQESKQEPAQESEQNESEERQAAGGGSAAQEAGFYTISLNSFGSLNEAKNFQNVLDEDTFIYTEGSTFEVRYGKYDSKEKAEEDLKSKFSEVKSAKVVPLKEL